jgi:hypothetical protein
MIQQFYADRESVAHAHQQLRLLVHPLSEAQLRYRPAPQEWSVSEIVGHLIDTEQLLRYRIERMCQYDQPLIIPMDQDESVQRNGYQQADVSALFGQLANERQYTQHFLAILPIRALGRTGWHAQGGLWQVANTVNYLARHDYLHCLPGTLDRTGHAID